MCGVLFDARLLAIRALGRAAVNTAPVGQHFTHLHLLISCTKAQTTMLLAALDTSSNTSPAALTPSPRAAASAF